ncbi:hypothetical protein [Burkholderia sp. 567]|uniref:hypothetical protein n=1 Tax=Burkholderia sp. 567 TaxID=3156413 RepID=UPI003395E4A0
MYTRRWAGVGLEEKTRTARVARYFDAPPVQQTATVRASASPPSEPMRTDKRVLLFPVFALRPRRGRKLLTVDMGVILCLFASADKRDKVSDVERKTLSP